MGQLAHSLQVELDAERSAQTENENRLQGQQVAVRDLQIDRDREQEIQIQLDAMEKRHDEDEQRLELIYADFAGEQAARLNAEEKMHEILAELVAERESQQLGTE